MYGDKPPHACLTDAEESNILVKGQLRVAAIEGGFVDVEALGL